jgi:hypothetical protein
MVQRAQRWIEGWIERWAREAGAEAAVSCGGGRSRAGEAATRTEAQRTTEESAVPIAAQGEGQ